MNALCQRIKAQIKKHHSLYLLIYHIKIYGLYLINRLSHYQLEKRRFYRKLGYHLNLKNPKSYNEKIVWKKIYDRNPLLPVTADKYQVRSYIKEVLGEEQANEILIPLLYVTDKPEIIPFEKLPPVFIIKPNHASGRYIIMENGNFNKEEIIVTCKKWLVNPFGLDRLEWAYLPIKRKIVIEELLSEDNGRLLKEYLFYMFNGKCKFVQVRLDRINYYDSYSLSFFDEKLNFLPVKIPNFRLGEKIEKPKNYYKMLELAEKLAEPFDHVRMDFYNLNGKIFFGEFTHYTASGMGKYEPKSFCYELGKHWKIEPGYWENK